MKKTDSIVAVFLLSFGWIVLSETLLGFFGMLNFTNFLVSNFSALVVVFFLCFSRWGRWCKILSGFNRLHLLYVPLVLILICLFVVASRQPVIEADALTYHMPCVAEWFQTGSLWHPYYTAYSGVFGYYPSNYELVTLFTVFVSGGDYFVNLVNFLLYLPLFAALYGIFRILKINGGVAIVAPAIMLYSPIIIRQSGIPQNDLFLVFTFVASLYFLLKMVIGRSVKVALTDVVFFSIALGLLLGTKVTGVAFAGILFVLFLLLVRGWKRILLVFSGMVLFGGFWYLRNFLIAGNPFFPIDVEIFGLRLFDGYLGLTEALRGFSMIENLEQEGLLMKFLRNYVLSSGGFGITALFGMVGGICYLGWSLVRRVIGKKELIISMLVVSGCLFGFLYLISPYSYVNIYPNIRYLLPFMVVGLVLAVYVFEFLGVKVFIVGMIISSIFNFLLILCQERWLEFVNDYVFFRVELYPFLFILSVVLLVLLLIIHGMRKPLSWLGMTVVLVALYMYFSWSFEIRSKVGYGDEFIQDVNTVENEHKYVIPKDLLSAFDYVNENIPSDAKIAFTNLGSHYPLFGDELRREVDYININDCRDCVYHDFKYSPKSILISPDYDDWKENLKFYKKQYLFFADYFDWSPKYEKRWADDNPDEFKLIYSKGNVYIYEVDLK